MADIDRRQFLKTASGAVIAAAATGTFAGCGQKGYGTQPSTEGGMTYRTNGRNGDVVSLLGYGCMRWPMTKDKDGNEIVDQEAVNRLVDHAIAHGVNYFDAAPVYLQGLCEKATGTALKRYPREKVFIATKLSNFNEHSREHALELYRNSLENFQTDYIDYYLLHSLGRGGLERFNKRFVDNGIMDFLLEERKKGHIRNLGFSFHGSRKDFDQMLSLHEKYNWDFVQIQLNYMDWTHASRGNTDAKYLQAELDKRGIPSVIMEPLLGGRLAKVPDHIATRLKERAPQKSIASWAFRFAGTHPGVLCVLSGMTYMEHLQDNLATYSPLVPLGQDDMDFLEETAEIMHRYPLVPCNDCKYCVPCPYGIDIPAILLHYNKCVGEGNIAADSGSENYRTARRAYLVGYDRAVPKINQADRCIGCNTCVSQCPQGINIPKEIHRISAYVEKLRRETL